MSEPDAKRIKLTDGSASPVRERTLIALEKSK